MSSASKQITQNHSKPSRKHYELSIDDVIVFPDIAHVPALPPKPGESWYVLTEINDTLTEQGLPVFWVEDKIKGHFWKVVFCGDNKWEDSKDCKPGMLLCVKNGLPKPYANGTYGYYTVLSKDDFILLPCTMDKLREINAGLIKRSKDGLLHSCNACNEPVKRCCGACKTRYCSKECQRQDWRTHKPICTILKTLHEWNRTDWG